MAEVDSFQEINRKYFNQIAHTYDDILPTMREHTAKIAQVMTEQVKLDPETTSVMDFACGTGLVSINLVPYVKEVIGVDISEAMVEKYNEKASLNEVSAKKMKAVLLDISKDKEGLGGKKFDAIIPAIPPQSTYALMSEVGILPILIPGILVTFSNTLGFEENQIREVYEKAGLKDFSWIFVGTWEFEKTPISMFMAKGTRPAD
ncbi:hypothetical protein FRC03_006983 [Tulasnella sp. 419]|nr:hypothetical protein FRC03_006983 [Tulasnella sp. 419]